MSAKKPDILLAGCGKMGGAMLTRWRDLGLYNDICIVEPSGHAPEGMTPVASFDDIPAGFMPDLIIMAVKPQVLPEVLPAYRQLTDKGAALLSIAAGKPIAFFENILGEKARLIRAMPNTPAAIGSGMTVACANAAVTDADRAAAESLLSAVGLFLWAEDEKMMDPVTAVSGSGPAYIFLLIEAMAEAGAALGLPPEMAQTLARQTVIGSALLAQQSPETPAATLRQNVTSPGGTTAAALDVLMQDSDGLRQLMTRALAAAAKRAEELSK